jgi:hypothetical protein
MNLFHLLTEFQLNMLGKVDSFLFDGCQLLDL